MSANNAPRVPQTPAELPPFMYLALAGKVYWAGLGRGEQGGSVGGGAGAAAVGVGENGRRRGSRYEESGRRVCRFAGQKEREETSTP